MRNTRKWLVAVVVLWSAAWCVCAENVSLQLIDVGHGDAIYIRLPGGYDVLIDAGKTGTAVVEVLRENMADGLLDLLVATHYHADHVGGLRGILQAEGLRVLDVLSPGVSTPECFASAARSAVSQSGGTWYKVSETGFAPQSMSWTFGEYKLSVVGPRREHTVGGNKAVNNNSAVLLLSGPAVRALFMGDAEQIAELDVVYHAREEGMDLKVDVLKVGHHGSNTSTTWSLLAATQPALALISGSGRHTSSATLERLAAAGACVYATYHHGHVRLTFGPNGRSVETQNGSGPLTVTPQVHLVAGMSTGLSLRIGSVSNPVRPHQTAKVDVQTKPGACCTISVYYASGPSKSESLGSIEANARGQASWSWRVGGNTSPGPYYAEVTASRDGQIVVDFVRFMVK